MQQATQMYVPKFETRSDEKPLLAPEPVSNYERPKLGHILYLDEHTSEPRKYGKHRVLIAGVYPSALNEREKQMVDAGHPPPCRMDLSFDYTIAKRYPLHRMNQFGEFADTDYAMIREHVEHNSPISRAVDELLDAGDTRETCVICMTGPSLNETAPVVDALDRSRVAVIAVNSAALKVRPDYYFAIDRRIKPDWSQAAAAAGATLVVHPMVPSATVDAFEPERRYIYGMPGRHKLNEMVRCLYSNDHYGMAEFEMGANVGCTAIHFAFAMGFRRIVIVGMDVVWNEEGSLHWKKDVNQLLYDSPEDVKQLVVQDDSGENVYAKCRTEYLRAYMMTCGHAYWLLKAGCEVINATGSGLCWEWPGAFMHWCIEERPDINGKLCRQTAMMSYNLEALKRARVL